MSDELDDLDIDAICEAAQEAAIHAWGPAGVMGGHNPYPDGSEAAEVWACAFRNAYARENGY